MRNFLALILAIFLASNLQAEEKPVRLLTIGNSFANNAIRYLGDIAKAGGKDLVICPMNLGGHSLEQHASYIAAYEKNPADPKGSPYKDPKGPAGSKISLRQALESDKWDYVTIQQVSTKSFLPETFEPHAKTIIEYVRKYAPQAEILILETWAYRDDHNMFASGQLDQEKMYEGLHAAYRELSQRYGLRIVPIGSAFQIARKNPLWKPAYPDPSFNYKAPKKGELPKETGDLTVGWVWRTNRLTGELEFVQDAKHANVAGCFLGAATLYQTIFPGNVENNPFRPSGLSVEEATVLRRIAHDVAGAAAADTRTTAVR